MYLILFITLAIYIGMVFFSKHRTAITFIGAGLLLTLGVIKQSFDPLVAFQSFPSEIIILVIVLALFTDVFERAGLINYIGYKFLQFSKSRRIVIIICMPLLMYVTSLFMNNLTVVLLFTSMALCMAMDYKLPIIPLLVSIVIGSNIGGAALPWADTPAVILTLYTDFTLIDFLFKLFIPCFVYSIGLSLYSYLWYRRDKCGNQKGKLIFNNKPVINKQEIKIPAIIFILYIISVSIAPFYKISIAYVSLFFGGILLLLQKRNPMDALNGLQIMDSITFLAALFLMGGILENCGFLKIVADSIMGITGSSSYLIALAVLLIAFCIATLLSAGPAAATLLPICQALESAVPNKFIYVALALGILAGSSMLPWSATGGPILLSEVNRFLKQVDEVEEKKRIEQIFSLKKYIIFSIPFSVIMLALDIVYIFICIAVIG